VRAGGGGRKVMAHLGTRLELVRKPLSLRDKAQTVFFFLSSYSCAPCLVLRSARAVAEIGIWLVTRSLLGGQERHQGPRDRLCQPCRRH